MKIIHHASYWLTELYSSFVANRHLDDKKLYNLTLVPSKIKSYLTLTVM